MRNSHTTRKDLKYQASQTAFKVQCVFELFKRLETPHTTSGLMKRCTIRETHSNTSWTNQKCQVNESVLCTFLSKSLHFHFKSCLQNTNNHSMLNKTAFIPSTYRVIFFTLLPDLFFVFFYFKSSSSVYCWLKNVRLIACQIDFFHLNGAGTQTYFIPACFKCFRAPRRMWSENVKRKHVNGRWETANIYCV